MSLACCTMDGCLSLSALLSVYISFAPAFNVTSPFSWYSFLSTIAMQRSSCYCHYVTSVSSDGQCLSDVKRRIALASSVMASLKKIWRDRRLSLPIKIRTYKALVLSTLLYAAETWTRRAEDARILESFHMKCQRQILNIRWQDHVRNIEVTSSHGARCQTPQLHFQTHCQDATYCPNSPGSTLSS